MKKAVLCLIYAHLPSGSRAYIPGKALMPAWDITLYIYIYIYIFSIARFKLHAHEYILVSAHTFSPSSQAMLMSKGGMLASKGSMLSSKGNMLSCIILLVI